MLQDESESGKSFVMYFTCVSHQDSMSLFAQAPAGGGAQQQTCVGAEVSQT